MLITVALWPLRNHEDPRQRIFILGWADGLHAATNVWVVTHAFSDSQDEMTWMALYFSLGVLISIAFSLSPAARDRAY